MRLYTTTGATQFDDPEYGTFKANADGAFDGLPDEMYAKLHGFPGWENDAEREMRITKEELDRVRDPAELLKAVKELGANQGILTAAIASALGLTQQAAPAQDAAPTKSSKSSNVSKAADDSTDASNDGSEGGGDESSTEAPAPADSTATSKTTTGRGRGSKASKTAASDAS